MSSFIFLLILLGNMELRTAVSLHGWHDSNRVDIHICADRYDQAGDPDGYRCHNKVVAAKHLRPVCTEGGEARIYCACGRRSPV